MKSPVRRLTCWPGLPPTVYLRRPGERLPFPGEAPEARLYAFARQGLWHGVRSLGLGAGDELLVPAYHHGSEVEALHRAGITCLFYGSGDGVHPQPAELDALCSPRTRGLYLVHTLGLAQEAPRWRRWCDERGLLLLEDAAQAWLADVDGEPVGARADLAVFCAYKTVPVSEGAFVVARVPVPPPPPGDHRGVAAVARRHGAWLAQRSPTVSFVAEALSLTCTDDPSKELDLRLDRTSPRTTTEYLLRRLADGTVPGVRRANYRLLQDSLAAHVPEPFARLPDGASPFAFPLEVPDKPRALHALATRGIRALDLWSTPHPTSPRGRFEAVDRLRRHVIGLPVHQDLSAGDVEALAEAGTAVTSTRRRTARPPVELLPDLPSAQDAWQQVASRNLSPFGSYEWAQSWQDTVGAPHEPAVAVCRDHTGRPAAVLALERSRRSGVRLLRFWGAAPADLSGPVCAPGDEVLAARGLRALLAELDPWDVLLAERLPGRLSWPTMMGTAAASREASPMLRIPTGGWMELLGARSANLRQQVRRRERRLLERPGTRFRLADAATLERDLGTLFHLHGLRWPQGSDFLRLRPFHEDFARRAMARGWLRLWVLEVEEQPVAAWYGFRFARAEWYYQAGRDPAWDQLQAGFVLLAHSIRSAADDGMRAYHFLRGDEPFKYRFATADEGTDTAVLAGSPTGRACARALTATAALPESARRALRRLAA